MSVICAITGDWLILALTPVERWQAARKLDNTVAPQQWLYMAGAAVLLILAGVYAFFIFKRRTIRSEKREDNFVEQSHRRGLSERERRILVYVAKLAGLKDYSAIFTMKKAFDRGSSALVREVSSSEMGAERMKRLSKELKSIREKLGFQEHLVGSNGDAAVEARPSSRTIPEGKTLYITRRTNRDVDDIEVVVVLNSDEGISVKLPIQVNSPPNEQWQVRYFYGASVWEFDVAVISNEGNVLLLGHSEEIRFINRRRFPRVAVNKKAYIASFPFEKRVFSESASGMVPPSGIFESRLALPQFSSAVLMELAGPGLRIESELELEIGQRVAVVFELESQVIDETKGEELSDKPVARVIEGVGIVRHVKAAEKGFSAAVELIGLSDADVSELIRATNVAAVQASGRNGKRDDESEDSESVTAALTA